VVNGSAIAQSAPGVDRAISVFEKALPAGWVVHERKTNENDRHRSPQEQLEEMR
jgi:hypothetical protein